ncbi:hypothetical protein F2P79_026015, partial [Pimephales promelas]
MGLSFCSSKSFIFSSSGLPSSSSRKGSGLCRTISSGNVTSKTLSLSNTGAKCRRTPRDSPRNKAAMNEPGRAAPTCRGRASRDARAPDRRTSSRHVARTGRATSPRLTQTTCALQVYLLLELLRSIKKMFLGCQERLTD